MKLATFSVQTEQHIGLVKNDQIISLTALGPEEFPACMKKFIERSSKLRTRAEQLIEQRVNDDAIFDLSEVKILPPIAKPDKIICVGLNYFDHCKGNGDGAP
ncbi:hypothetical protein [Peribacillus simplex]|uniref:hypothetical protein n=1 Tax=Peribacillus simplex TaxID=1478 RepID=UPI0024C205CC|nr:hypothetical protein [Peribacillus simplex]WHY54485.1 hypothetical protein QNH43_14935 [Peribacillus simplex]